MRSSDINYTQSDSSGSVPKESQKLLNSYRKTQQAKTTPQFESGSDSVDINEIDWDKLISVESSESGSGGVLKCGFNDGSACVLKGCSDIVPEYFTYLLFERLQIPVPKMRVVQFTDPELNTLLLRLNARTYHDQLLKIRIRRSLDRPFILVIEYLASYGIGDLGPVRAASLFQDDVFKGYEHLRSIGNILAADLFINNCDRVPLIWNHDGNPNNLLVSFNSNGLDNQAILDDTHPSFKGIYAIDSRCYCIKNNDPISSTNFQSYITRLTTYLANLFQELSLILTSKMLDSVSFQTISPLKRYLELYTGFTLQKTHCFQVLKGLVYGLKLISDLDQSDIMEIYSNLELIPKEDWMSCWDTGMKSLNLSFMFSTQGVIRSCMNSNTASIDWVIKYYPNDEYPLYCED